MPRTVLQIYAAAVCFVSVGCLSIALGIAAYSTIGMFNPGLTAHPMSLVPPPAAPYVMPPMPADAAGLPGSPNAPSTSPPVAGDEANRRAAALEAGLRNEVIVSKQSVLRWGIVALISVLLFLTHWRILRRGA